MALIFFTSENDHPLAFLLHRKYRHVFCARKVGDFWVVYDWAKGYPEMHVTKVDVVAHYRDQGCTVIEVNEASAVLGPIVLNNCVGHVKSICGIRSWAVTPWQLFKHLTKERSFMPNLFTLPGFGGGKPPSPPPPPPPPPKPPVAEDEGSRKRRSDKQAQLAAARGMGGTIVTGAQGVTNAPRTTSTLL